MTKLTTVQNPMLTLFMPAMAWMNLWARMGETLWASAQVITHRTDMMRDAGASPSAAHMREMQRMVSEKVQAFSDAQQQLALGSAAIGPALPWSVGMNWLRASSAAGSLASSSTWPQLFSRQAELWRTLNQGAPAAQKLSHEIAKLSTKALRPVHAKATANAKRLGARRRTG